MKILHTADWHLGVSAGPVSRGPEHDRFLAWLADELESREIDVLVVAGDVFDTHSPSAEASQRYYRFLAQAATKGVAQVIVVGGNHDSASRLDAPAEVLRALDVHVVGGLTQESLAAGDHLIPLRSRAGEVEAVILAVPYVHEFRLGVRTTDSDQAETRRLFTEAFQRVYSSLADLATAQYPGLPIVATGHLTVGEGVTREDYPQEIHQVGTIDALPASLFDARISYVALGHIHRSYPADPDRRVWYSGTPVAVALPEARLPRRVLQVRLERGDASVAEVEAVEVPMSRALLEMEGEPEEMLTELRSLEWVEPLPPLLYLRVVADELPVDLQSRLQDALAVHPECERPVIVELRQRRKTPLQELGPEQTRALEEMTPREVFRSLAQASGVDADDQLLAAFDQLAGMGEDDLDAEVRRIKEGVE